MRLRKLHVHNFRCVRDSNEFRIEPDVTCLVGKNRSGKTALLEALTRLNSADERFSTFTDLDYPRADLNEYQERGETAVVLETTWEMSQDDRTAVEELVGPAGAAITSVRISKGYDNDLSFEVALDEAAVVSHLLSDEGLLEDEKAMLDSAQDLSALRAALSQLEDPSQRQRQLLERIQKSFGDGSAKAAVEDVIQERMPVIAYFPSYRRMDAKVAVEELRKLQQNNSLSEGQEVFLALLAMTNRTVDELEKITETERLIADLEGVSNRITATIKKYWSQDGHLKIEFAFAPGLAEDPPPFNSGWVLQTRVENLRHGVTTSFNMESAGFQWFFSFLVWFSQLRKRHGSNVLILLDEPGLSLHAKAQNDLLRYIERELVRANEHQVIYTTHSSFMIDPEYLLRARTVEDVFVEPDAENPEDEGSDEGTKVGDDILSTDRDTVFPLQAALGYEITQTLFVGKHNLIVEGPSDLLYLNWFRHRLAAASRETLDRRWTIAPSSGIDKVMAFVTLFGGSRLHVAVLTDVARGSKRKVRDIRESKLLQQGHVFTADAFSGKAEADVEDLIGDDAYISLVNACYGLSGTEAIAVPPAGDPERQQRIVPRIEACFRTMPPAAPLFDHYQPAVYLTQRGHELNLPGLDDALPRFERLFSALNALLPGEDS